MQMLCQERDARDAGDREEHHNHREPGEHVAAVGVIVDVIRAHRRLHLAHRVNAEEEDECDKDRADTEQQIEHVLDAGLFVLGDRLRRDALDDLF